MQVYPSGSNVSSILKDANHEIIIPTGAICLGSAINTANRVSPLYNISFPTGAIYQVPVGKTFIGLGAMIQCTSWSVAATAEFGSTATGVAGTNAAVPGDWKAPSNALNPESADITVLATGTYVVDLGRRQWAASQYPCIRVLAGTFAFLPIRVWGIEV